MITAVDMAARLGATRVTVYRLETGRTPLTVAHIAAYSKALDLNRHESATIGRLICGHRPDVA